MTVPHQIICALRTSTGNSKGQLLPKEVEEKNLEIPFCGFYCFDESLVTSNPISTNDETIFRPISAERSKWCPPLYRDTTLLSSPSTDLHYYCSSSSTSDSSADHHLTEDEVSDRSPSSTLPADFIPPRHKFSTCSGRTLTDQTNTALSCLPTHHAIKLQSDDIVCGRGAPVSFHPGNQAYREVIKQYETTYLCSKRSEKPQIAMEVLEILKARGARFVKREKEDCGMIWVEISEQRAYERVCQSLREGAPEARRRMLATTMKSKKKANAAGDKILFADESLFFRDECNYSPIPIDF